MALVHVSRDEATKRLVQSGHGTADSTEMLGDLLRAEVHARGHAPRAATLSRLARLLAPAITVGEDRLAGVCDGLEREGDLVLAPGGVLYATPTRVVVAKQRARVFGSLPTRVLAAALGRDVSVVGATRTVVATDDLGESVSRLDGAMVSPEAWAGLDRAPRADAAFIARLDHRLDWEASSAGALERDGALDWRSWELTGESPRWRRGHEGRLWWARSRFGGHHRAWTTGASPAAGTFVALSADDADRARFALAREAGGRLALVVQRAGDASIIEVPAWLPRPEYRWLSLHAEPAPEGKGMHWRVTDDGVRIATLLSERLGLVVEVR